MEPEFATFRTLNRTTDFHGFWYKAPSYMNRIYKQNNYNLMSVYTITKGIEGSECPVTG